MIPPSTDEIVIDTTQLNLVPFPSAVETIDAILNANAWTRIFVVTQKEAYVHSGAAVRVDPILEGRRVTWFTEFSPNPKFEESLAGIFAFRKSRAEVILGIGGGTAMDMAKLIAALSPQIEEPAEIVAGHKPLVNAPVPIIAVPTTAGTGSEATHFAVVYMDDRKFSLADPGMLPRFQILDPTLTHTMPPYLTAVTGLDAFSQAMESLWSIHSTDRSRRLASEALVLAWENLENATLHPTPEVRARMCRASHLAGQAIQITKTTAPHAISYAMTSRFGLPHGHAVAMTLGPMLQFNSGVTGNDCQDPRGVVHVADTIKDIIRHLGFVDGADACAGIRAMMDRIGCASRLAEIGIKGRASLDYLCDQVNGERLANNPRRLTPGHIHTMLESIS